MADKTLIAGFTPEELASTVVISYQAANLLLTHMENYNRAVPTECGTEKAKRNASISLLNRLIDEVDVRLAA